MTDVAILSLFIIAIPPFRPLYPIISTRRHSSIWTILGPNVNCVSVLVFAESRSGQTGTLPSFHINPVVIIVKNRTRKDRHAIFHRKSSGIFSSRTVHRPMIFKGSILNGRSSNPVFLPSSTIIITLENQEYMAMMKEKLAEIKEAYKNPSLSPISIV